MRSIGIRRIREFVMIAAGLAAGGCDALVPSSVTGPSSPDAAYCPATPATRLDIYESGPIPTTSSSFPIAASPGDLLVISVVGAIGGGLATPVMSVSAGTTQIQVSTSTSCGHNAMVWTVGDIQTPLDHIDLHEVIRGTVDVFVARFAGLPAHTGSQEALFARSQSGETAPWTGEAPRVSVCAGAAVVTTMVSCAPLSLRNGTEFTLIGSTDGMASAALIPSAPGAYGADWNISEQWSAVTFAFPRMSRF